MTTPAPPYPCPLPERYRETPYADLPRGLQVRVDLAVSQGETPPE